MVTTNPSVARSGPNPLAALREEVARRRGAGQALIDLSIGDPDEPTPPAVREALREAIGPVSSYPTGRGQAGTRAAIAGFMSRRHGVLVDPDTQVLPTSGSKEAIFHLPLAFIDPAGPRRTVVWGSPGYPTYARGTRLAGGEPHAVVLRDEDGWRLDLAALDEELLARTCIAWLGYPHNPTGATVDTAYLRDQLAVARAHDILLCSDECYQEIWFDVPAPSLLEVAGEDLAGTVEAVRHDRVPLGRTRRRRERDRPPAHAARGHRDGLTRLRPGGGSRGVVGRRARRRAPRRLRSEA
jgi:aspartate/methionine/tyrosine aminotransferase